MSIRTSFHLASSLFFISSSFAPFLACQQTVGTTQHAAASAHPQQIVPFGIAAPAAIAAAPGGITPAAQPVPLAAAALVVPALMSPTITVAPATVQVGGQYVALLTIDSKSCPAALQGKDVGRVLASSTTDITADLPVLVTGNPCQITVAFKVSPAATLGAFTLFLYPSAPGPILGSVSGSIAVAQAAIPGLIPPGMVPGSDVMFKVLPRKAVADSYGNRVADHYFAIEATIGNSSGYDLQLAAIGFQLPPGDALASAPVPNDAYPIVRGTVEREQSVGTRAIIVNLMKAAGPMLTGVSSFVDGGMSLNLLEGSNLFSGAFEKGVELVYPDLTTNHLINLDNRILRDGVIISNNTSVRANVFISRELVECVNTDVWYRFYPFREKNKAQRCTLLAGEETTTAPTEKVPETPSAHGAATTVDNSMTAQPSGKSGSTKGLSKLKRPKRVPDTRVAYRRDFDPNKIKVALGQMVLVGRNITYINRVRVVSTTLPDAQVPPLLLAPSITVASGVATLQIVLTGLHLNGAAVTSTTPNLTVLDYSAGADGTSVTFHLDTRLATKGDVYTLQVSTSSGLTLVSVTMS